MCFIFSGDEPNFIFDGEEKTDTFPTGVGMNRKDHHAISASSATFPTGVVERNLWLSGQRPNGAIRDALVY